MIRAGIDNQLLCSSIRSPRSQRVPFSQISSQTHNNNHRQSLKCSNQNSILESQEIKTFCSSKSCSFRTEPEQISGHDQNVPENNHHLNQKISQPPNNQSSELTQPGDQFYKLSCSENCVDSIKTKGRSKARDNLLPVPQQITSNDHNAKRRQGDAKIYGEQLLGLAPKLTIDNQPCDLSSCLVIVGHKELNSNQSSQYLSRNIKQLIDVLSFLKRAGLSQNSRSIVKKCKYSAQEHLPESVFVILTGRVQFLRLSQKSSALLCLQQERFILRKILERSAVFSELGATDLVKALNCFRIKKFTNIKRQGLKIKVLGKKCRDFVLINILQIPPAAGKNSIVAGEMGLWDKSKDSRYQQDLTIYPSQCGEIVLAVTSHQRLCAGLGIQDLDILLSEGKITQAELSELDLRRKGSVELFQQISLSDLICQAKLGEGEFGTVYLVRPRDHLEQSYALKCICKHEVLELKLQRHIQEEKRVMEALVYPFITSFIRSYRDEEFIYFLLEHVNGNQLFEVIRVLGLLTKSQSQFYIGSILLALEYFHSLNIVYRDLKPENIMVDYQGFVKIIDMGTCKRIKQRTYTIIGTPHYMAPEILDNKGYSFEADLWSLGVCLYEFVCGYLPFGDNETDAYTIHHLIKTTPLVFPSTYKDQGGKQLMRQLLSLDPEQRLPNKSYKQLKKHRWFQGLNWDKLAGRSLNPPYRPASRSWQAISGRQKTVRQEMEQVKNKIVNRKLSRKRFDPDWDSMF